MSATHVNGSTHPVYMKTVQRRMSRRNRRQTKGEWETHKGERLKENQQSTETSDTTKEATSNSVVQETSSTHTSTVIPVWLSTTSNPENEILMHALLDNQSDTTFIL